MHTLQSLCRNLVDSVFFQRFIIGVILAAGIIMGMETYPSLMEDYGSTLHFLDQLILLIFVLEISLKFLALGKNFLTFFSDPWNVFDFIIISVCLLPIESEFAAVLRLVRILRVLRLVSVLPRLQILVGALLRSIPSMGYVALLLSLLLYMYAVLGTAFFGLNDPMHFGNLQRSMLTLFQVVTLEGWPEFLKIQMYGSDAFGGSDMLGMARESVAQPLIAAIYFVSFILFGTMIMLNLLIGVVINSMSEIHQEAEKAASATNGTPLNLTDKITEIEKLLKELKDELKNPSSK